MSDLIRSVHTHTDIIRAVIVTRFFNLEGDIHSPRIGKEGRRLSNLLNSDRRFIAMTNVAVTNRMTGVKDPTTYDFIEVNIESIEFVQPHLEASEVARESKESAQSIIS